VGGGDNIRFIHANDINGLQPLKTLLTDSLHNAVNGESRAAGSAHVSLLLLPYLTSVGHYRYIMTIPFIDRRQTEIMHTNDGIY
jgi:hypothetical protein